MYVGVKQLPVHEPVARRVQRIVDREQHPQRGRRVEPPNVGDPPRDARRGGRTGHETAQLHREHELDPAVDREVHVVDPLKHDQP